MLGGKREAWKWVAGGVGTGNYDNEKRGETHIKFGDKGLMVRLSTTNGVVAPEDFSIVVNLTHKILCR